ncbi:MAG: 2-dehydropantoate 2-reductase [Casimicrobiaceae bacterium]
MYGIDHSCCGKTAALVACRALRRTPVSLQIAFIGAGALGGFTGGLMARAGHAVSLIDPWPLHVERIRSDGLLLTGTHGEYRVELPALHLGEVQRLVHRPVDIAFVCVKLYDTRWCTELVAPYLAAGGFVVTMQNGLVEEEVAQVVGWSRVVGCIASKVQVELVAPGEIRRTNPPGAGAHTAFRVGEVHGRSTVRAAQVVRLLEAVDSARITANLWGERWSKLVANAMTSPLCAVTGLSFKEMYALAGARRVIAHLAAEAIELGRALGYELEPVFGADPDLYIRAAHGDTVSLAELGDHLEAAQASSLPEGRSGIAQDIAKGRRTEVDYFNGYIVARARGTGVSADSHAAITALVHAIERGEARPNVANLDALAIGGK